MTSSSRSLFTANALVTTTLIVGFANNIAIAAIFGLTRRVDAYYAAQVLPNLVMVLGLDYLGKNFLPTLTRAKKKDEELAAGFTSSIVTIVGVAALALSLVLALASGRLFALLLPGFRAEDLVLVSHYFWIMAPAIVFMSITVINEYVCQHDEEFAAIAAIRAVLPVANLSAILIASPFLGEYALPLGYVLGHFVVFVLMARQSRYRYRWRVAIRREWEGRVFANSAIVMSSGLVARTRLLILNYLGSLLGAGAISALAMSTKLIEPLGRSIFTAVRMLMFSRTARLAAVRNSKEMARIYDLALSASFLLLAPLLWWLGLNSAVVVDVLFVRGEFDMRMAALVSLALIGAAPSVVFTGTNGLMSNAFYAMDRIVVPAFVMPLGTLIYLGLAVSLAPRFGVLGLTASTTTASVAVFLIMLPLLARHVPELSAERTLLRVLLYAVVGGICIGGPTLWLESLQAPGVVRAAASLAAGLLLYASLLYAVKDRILAFIFQFARRAFRMPSPASNASG